MGTGVWRVGPIAHAASEADRLLPNLNNLGNHEVDRRQPFASLPVVGTLALQPKRPRLGRRVGDEGLQVCLVEIGAVGVAGEGPDVVGENADRPATALPDKYPGRTRAPFPGAGCGRQQKDWPYCPGDAINWSARRKIEPFPSCRADQTAIRRRGRCRSGSTLLEGLFARSHASRH